MMTREDASDILSDEEISCLIGKFHRAKEAVALALTALRPVSREQVEQIFRTRDDYLCRNGGVMHPCFYCTSCGYECDDYYSRDESRMPDNQFQFCPCCGKAVTDEAVQILIERMEELKNES